MPERYGRSWPWVVPRVHRETDMKQTGVSELVSVLTG